MRRALLARVFGLSVRRSSNVWMRQMPDDLKVKTDKGIKIHEHIVLHLVTTGEDDGQLGWAHSHGMEKFNLPNLEIRGVPLFLGKACMGLINHVAQYMVDGQTEGWEVKLGEVMGTGPMATFKFVQLDPIPGAEPHFEHPMWALSDEPMRGLCAGHDASQEAMDEAAERPV